MTLDDLEQLAKKATPGPWGVGTSAPTCIKTDNGGVIARMGPSARDHDDEYIAAVSPETVLKLIAIARAAEAVQAKSDRLIEQMMPAQRKVFGAIESSEREALRAALDAFAGEEE